ncbi:hypothetical protein QQ045_032919 [Rhodiola kirilowii]
MWLEDGDNNTKYFHAYASARKRMNNIARLIDDSGHETTDPERIKDIITQHYKGFFSQSHSISQQEILYNLRCVQRKVTEQQNDILTAPDTEQEITRALFQLHPSKAPGKDGFNAAFFQNCWPIVKRDFIADCLNFLNDDSISTEANATLITLIPKVKGAVKVTDFRPITLIGVKMKVISKVIVNRLQQIMNEVISQEQCAFVPTRLITDNLIISHEILHYIRRVTAHRRKVYGSLKLDIAKAYDMVDRTFL